MMTQPTNTDCDLLAAVPIPDGVTAGPWRADTNGQLSRALSDGSIQRGNGDITAQCQHCTVPVDGGNVCGFCKAYTPPPTAPQRIDDAEETERISNAHNCEYDWCRADRDTGEHWGDGEVVISHSAGEDIEKIQCYAFVTVDDHPAYEDEITVYVQAEHQVLSTALTVEEATRLRDLIDTAIANRAEIRGAEGHER